MVAEKLIPWSLLVCKNTKTMNDVVRKNEIDIVQIRGEIKLLSEKLDVIKQNDLFHIQKAVDNINRVLWAVGLLILGHMGLALKTALWS